MRSYLREFLLRKGGVERCASSKRGWRHDSSFACGGRGQVTTACASQLRQNAVKAGAPRETVLKKNHFKFPAHATRQACFSCSGKQRMAGAKEWVVSCSIQGPVSGQIQLSHCPAVLIIIASRIFQLSSSQTTNQQHHQRHRPVDFCTRQLATKNYDRPGTSNIFSPDKADCNWLLPTRPQTFSSSPTCPLDRITRQ